MASESPTARMANSSAFSLVGREVEDVVGQVFEPRCIGVERVADVGEPSSRACRNSWSSLAMGD